MKTLILGAALALGFAAPALGDPLDGTTWKTEVDDGAYAHVDM